MARVLVVDDDAGIRESAALALEKVGHRVSRASDAESARAIIAEERIDLVVTDIYMPGEDGIDLLKWIATRRRPPRVIVMTARGSIETATLAHQGGAFDYLAKPFALGDLIELVRAATADEPLPDEVFVEPAPESSMVGAHPSMVAVYKAVTRVAAVDVPVVILGETGTGKELVARAIHDFGPRAGRAFVPIHCGAIPDTLLENELFGSTRGAYTDSRHDRRGALVRADGGTVLLDEIGDISPAFQLKLLRFLQDGIVTPLGSEKTLHVDVRVVAATHRDLRSLVAEGTFRQDLFFRLSGYEIRIPPLRERASDIPLLVEHFRRRAARQLGRESVHGPSREVLDLLAAHGWPGNVRELEQAVRRIILDCGSLADAGAARRVLGGAVEPPPPAPVPPENRALATLEQAERNHIEAVLHATRGNQTRAARILGIERKTLARKLRRFGLAPADGAPS